MPTWGRWREKNAAKPLIPDLWSRLPSDMIDVIIHKVLLDLPFSKLYSFCSACKSWRNFLFHKAHYLLYFHIKGGLKALNSRTGIWEEISLKFCVSQVPGLKLRYLRLVSSAGGLLCLSNTADGEYIVCNPLTKCCRRLGKLRWSPRNIGVPKLPLTRNLGTRLISYATWLAESTPFNFENVLMIYQWNITGSLQLRLSSRSVTSDRREMVAHEYRRSREPTSVIISGIQNDFRFYADGPVMVAREQLAVGFSSVEFPTGFNVLVYDLRLSQYKWIMFPHIPRRRRKQVVVTFRGANQLQFEEIQDTGHTDIIFPPPLRKAFEELLPRLSRGLREIATAGKFFDMMSIEQDDVVYLVAMVAQTSTGPWHVIAVWRHCRVDNSDLISEMKAEWSGILGPWPLRTNFHVFEPSFTCTHAE